MVRLFLILCLLWSAAEAQNDLPVVKGKIHPDYDSLETEDMHACCKGFCGKNLKASSTLIDEFGTNYDVLRITDDKPHTAWVEGVPGDGIGESLSFSFAYDVKFEDAADGACYYKDEFFIANGYQKSKASFYENNRVKKMKVYVNEKPYCYVLLEDKMGAQSIKLGFIKARGKKKEALQFKFEIVEIYKGTKYDDTAISEIFW